jgi:hypothetical protein
MSKKRKTCVFCGASGKLTGEHVFGDWVSRIGLDVPESRFGAGPLNRSARDLGVSYPFARTVRDVCSHCNNGWMSNLESVARRVLTPFILGNPGSISKEDTAAIAAWVQKTALVGMLVSSEDERAAGYGVPQDEYWNLYILQQSGEPLPSSQVWIGHYQGEQRLSSIWVTPMVINIDGHAEPEIPQGYAVTIVLGELLFHGIRFTTPGLYFAHNAPAGFVAVWPYAAPVAWPSQPLVDDARFVRLSKGLEVVSQLANVSLAPWRPAVDLPHSTFDGSLVRLPTPCGKHFVIYPPELEFAAFAREYHAFMTSCECGKTYLVQTEADGAHFKAEGTLEAVGAIYERLPGDEFVIQSDAGQFVFKQIGG